MGSRRNRTGWPPAEGAPDRAQGGADVITDATPPGSIQVPGDGMPIIFLADGQATGGYAKIAVAITRTRINWAGQTGDRIRFQKVDSKKHTFCGRRCRSASERSKALSIYDERRNILQGRYLIVGDQCITVEFGKAVNEESTTGSGKCTRLWGGKIRGWSSFFPPFAPFRSSTTLRQSEPKTLSGSSASWSHLWEPRSSPPQTLEIPVLYGREFRDDLERGRISSNWPRRS